MGRAENAPPCGETPRSDHGLVDDSVGSVLADKGDTDHHLVEATGWGVPNERASRYMAGGALAART